MVQIELSTRAKSHIIKNLYPLYLHDLSPYSNKVNMHPNVHGVFGESNLTRCACQSDSLNIWWSKPGVLMPYIMRDDVTPIGFALVAAKPHTPQQCDFCLYEFFLVAPYRRRGMGSQVALWLFERYAGTWELNVLIKNTPAMSFWRSLLNSYTCESYHESPSALSLFPGCIAFRFTTGGHNCL